MPLDHVDRAAQLEAAVDQRRLRRAVLVAALHVGQAEGELEPLRRPLGAFVGELLEPDREGRCVIAAISSCQTRSIAGLRRSYSRSCTSRIAAVRRSLRGRQLLRRQRQQPVGLQPPQRRRLHLMEQVAARQRIHLLQRRRRFERRQPVDRGHQELVRARGVPLQRGQRVGPRAEPLRAASAARVCRCSHDAVRRIPLAAMMPEPARRQRALQLGAELVEIARAAFDAFRAPTRGARQSLNSE